MLTTRLKGFLDNFLKAVQKVAKFKVAKAKYLSQKGSMSSPNDYILSNLAALNPSLCRPKTVDSRLVWYSMIQCLDPETGRATNAIIIIENYSFLSSGVPKFTLESIISISYFAKKH